MSEVERKKSIQEIKILNIISHLNLVRLVESYATNNLLCIIMELGEYGSLDGEIEARRKGGRNNIYFAEDEILFILIQVLLGVKHLHDNNIIHCDIKPSNVLLFSNGVVKLSDFGVSSILSSNKGEQGASESISDPLIQGSIYYLAPEIYSDMDHDRRCDLWSIGCLLLELCSLERVFRKHSIQEMIILSLRNGDQFKKEVCNHIETHGVNKRYSKYLVDIIKSLLDPNPEERLSIEELIGSSGYISRFINMFLNTCSYKNWSQFNTICQELMIYVSIPANDKGRIDIIKHPFWIKQDVDNEHKGSKFFLKQSLDEWFKNQEMLASSDYLWSKSSMQSNQLSDGQTGETGQNTYRDIIDYFSKKEKSRPGGRRLSRKEILLQLETTVEFFVTQLSALNSKKVTTEEIIKRNLGNKLRDSQKGRNPTMVARTPRKEQTKSSQKPPTVNKARSNPSIRKDLRIKYDMEREQLREIMRRGRAEAKLKEAMEIETPS
ncbi:protein kinase [Cryptosporidium canis]|uniref:non-specific serine/threonine protein kinase n=1 Tax=Cryptosporidium canis TaxID=195482 RepID=A0A9D5HW28_9CRYT|nr:protein kinase [Cryptosporidium canis]